MNMKRIYGGAHVLLLLVISMTLTGGAYIESSFEVLPSFMEPEASNDAYGIIVLPQINLPAPAALGVSNGLTLAYGLSDAYNWGSPTSWCRLMVGPVTVSRTNIVTDARDTNYYGVAVTINGRSYESVIARSNAAPVIKEQYGSTTMIIKRSEDLVTWTPMFTNAIGVGTVEAWIDPEPLPRRAFYAVVKQ